MTHDEWEIPMIHHPCSRVPAIVIVRQSAENASWRIDNGSSQRPDILALTTVLPIWRDLKGI